VDSCLIICAPKLTEGIEFARPLSRTDFFHESLKAPQLGIELLHPTVASAPSFPVWLQREGNVEQALVPDKRLQNVFQSPSLNQGLLFLANSAQSDVRLSFEGARYHYSGVDAADFGQGSPLSFRPQGGALKLRFLRESRSPGEDLTHWQIGVGKPDRPPDAWMNPLLVRINLAGNGCEPPPAGALPSDTRFAFAQLMEQFDVLGLIPGFEGDDDARCRAWRLLLGEVGRRSPSAVERLILGAASTSRRDDYDVAWAFCALDALGGRFLVDGHGRSDPSQRGVSYLWYPHSRSTANTLWFAKQVVQRWNDGAPMVPTSMARERMKSNAPGTQFKVSNKPLPQARLVEGQAVLSFSQRLFAVAPQRFSPESLQETIHSLPNYLRSCADWQPDESAKRTLQFFQELLSDLADCGVPFNLRLHRRWFRLSGRDRLATDVPGLLNDLAQELVVPRSQVLFSLPQPTSDSLRAFVDLIAAVPGGARALIWALLRERGDALEERTLPLTMGWWNSWHTSLFDDPVEVRLRFRKTQFELGLAVLGKGQLGGAPDAKVDDETPVRFSVPL
jgi:hypothetical protein